MAEFLALRRQSERDDIACYRNKTVLREAIISAAKAERNDGKRHSHQRRITSDAIEESRARLLQFETQINSCASFDELFAKIDEILNPIRGVGELYIYDTAFRLGVFLGRSPDKVYLHCGTRDGAKKLGLPAHKSFLEMHELPRELQHLSATDAEDFLCIYKDEFSHFCEKPRYRGCTP